MTGGKAARWVDEDIADTLAGIAKDGSAEELQRLRQLRQEVRAEARVSKELAGTDTKAQEAEFLEYARKSAASSEFDALLGLAEKVDAIIRRAAPGYGSTRRFTPIM